MLSRTGATTERKNAKGKGRTARTRLVLFCLTSGLSLLAFCSVPYEFVSALLASPEAQTSAPARPDGSVLRSLVQLVAIGPGEQGKNQECSATGFLVNEEGYIITNAHVVEDARQCLGNSPNAKIVAKLGPSDSRTAPAVSCTVARIDEVRDLALLKTDRPPTVGPAAEQAFALLDPREAALGTPMIVSGYPGFAWMPVTQSGKLVWRGNRKLSEKSEESSEVLILDIHLRPGNSGSPVYLSTGDIVGVVVEGDLSEASHSIAVPIRYAIELMKSHGLRWHASQE